VRFNDIFSRLAEAGATKVFVPAAFPAERTDDYARLLAERATEHGYHVFGINAVGRDERHEYGGRSRAIAPDGTILAEVDDTAEAIVTVSI
jgi:predicted amidohydrolase